MADAQQSRTVNGRVLAGGEGVPVIGATVRGLGFAATADTDRNGLFTLDQVPRLQVRVVAEALGFVSEPKIEWAAHAFHGKDTKH